MRIVVIGGSGLVGAKLVARLQHRGQAVVSASRRSGVDTLTGRGLPEALVGATVLVNVINSPSFEDAAAEHFFRTSTRNVVAAAEAARVKHHVALSIVGSDRMVESGYFRGKIAQEFLIERSPIPHTILRSTQFFDFLPLIPQTDADGPRARVPPVCVQPVAADEVAAALADIATAPPRNYMIEHAGPQLFRLDRIVSRAMQATRDPRRIVADPQARFFGAELSEDTLTPDEGVILGVTRFDDWLKLTSARRAHGFVSSQISTPDALRSEGGVQR